MFSSKTQKLKQNSSLFYGKMIAIQFSCQEKNYPTVSAYDKLIVKFSYNFWYALNWTKFYDMHFFSENYIVRFFGQPGGLN